MSTTHQIHYADKTEVEKIKRICSKNELINRCKLVILKAKGKSYFEIVRSKYEGNIKMDRREI
jgi:hypothetical protein